MSARPPLTRGDVVLVVFPFSDLSGHKLRPAVIVSRVEGNDLTCAFITSQIGGGRRSSGGADCILEPANPEFRGTGLKAPSLVRLNKLATLQHQLVQRRIGRIGPQTNHSVAQALRYGFEL